MIIEGGARRNVKWFATHLQRTDQGQVVSIAEVRGLAGNTIPEWFAQLQAMALGTRGENAFYHANINPREDEELTPEQWDIAADVLEKKLGLDGQPRFIVQHEKEGRTHRHIFWSRVDPDTGTLIRDSHNYDRHMRAADALEREFDHERTPRGRGPEGPNPKNYEVFRGKESGISPYDAGILCKELWRQADTGQAFAAALEDHGFILARGDRGYIAIDAAADSHSLAKRLGIKMRDVVARMGGDVDLDQLPSVEEAKTLARARAKEGDERRELPAPSDKRDFGLAEISADLVQAIREAFRKKGHPADQHSEHGPGTSVDESGPPTDPTVAAPTPEGSHLERVAEEPAAVGIAADAAPELMAEALTTAYPENAPAPPQQARPGAEDIASPEYTVFDLLAQELTHGSAREAAMERPPQAHAPEPQLSPFDRLAYGIHIAADAAPALLMAGTEAAFGEGAYSPQEVASELSAFERIAQKIKQAMRDWSGGPSIAESLDWLAQRIEQPPLDAPRDPWERTPFERVAHDMKQAMAENGGEPEPGFWQRSIALMAAARDRALEWVREAVPTFAGLILQNRNSHHEKDGRER